LLVLLRYETTPGPSGAAADRWPADTRLVLGPDRFTLVPAKLQGLPVLVVDDNATNRRILRDVLTNWRMKPTLADGGTAALEALRQGAGSGEPFRLVLLDLMMPDLDGFTVAERIRQDPRLTTATILMLTSGWQKGEAGRCRDLGVAACLIKPIHQAELLDAILGALGVSRAVASPAAAVSPARTGRGLRILLGEDNPVNQAVIVRMLQKQGHAVTVAGNGKEALEKLHAPPGARDCRLQIEKPNPGMRFSQSAICNLQSAIPFDLVLMDVQMPEMDGFEATARIRQAEAGTSRRLPIVALTAHALKGDREKCLAAGMDAYLAKPVQAAELAGVIDSLVGEEPVKREAAREAAPAFDRASALAQLDGDEALLAEVAELFLSDCPRRLETIRTALAGGDGATLTQAAHALKGAVRYLGATEAAEAAQRLELTATEGNLAAAAETLRALEREIDRLTPALAELVSQPASA
jgi:CheY-like chemotaxis protein